MKVSSYFRVAKLKQLWQSIEIKFTRIKSRHSAYSTPVNKICVRFQVFTAVVVVFWDTALCSVKKLTNISEDFAASITWRHQLHLKCQLASAQSHVAMPR